MDEDFIIPEGWVQLVPQRIVRVGDRYRTYTDDTWRVVTTSATRTIAEWQQFFAVEERPVIFIRGLSVLNSNPNVSIDVDTNGIASTIHYTIPPVSCYWDWVNSTNTVSSSSFPFSGHYA